MCKKLIERECMNIYSINIIFCWGRVVIKMIKGRRTEIFRSFIKCLLALLLIKLSFITIKLLIKLSSILYKIFFFYFMSLTNSLSYFPINKIKILLCFSYNVKFSKAIFHKARQKERAWDKGELLLIQFRNN